ncbi:hypothetical protein RRG08_000711 [Elysia crispata]|uniref:Uncharacterized protein n=1 Tax=Elysia crispata TaxID=231223 RepID=A0AAE1AX86_9GAST|nr:hypothetical protein RRG08_000711 [Elysia crispata]
MQQMRNVWEYLNRQNTPEMLREDPEGLGCGPDKGLYMIDALPTQLYISISSAVWQGSLELTLTLLNGKQQAGNGFKKSHRLKHKNFDWSSLPLAGAEGEVCHLSRDKRAAQASLPADMRLVPGCVCVCVRFTGWGKQMTSDPAMSGRPSRLLGRNKRGAAWNSSTPEDLSFVQRKSCFVV